MTFTEINALNIKAVKAAEALQHDKSEEGQAACDKWLDVHHKCKELLDGLARLTIDWNCLEEEVKSLGSPPGQLAADPIYDGVTRQAIADAVVRRFAS